jgi:putative MFS transporter
MTASQTAAAELIARMENVPFTRWHAKCRIVMGSATFFDAFSALSLAFALPVLTGLWHLSPRQNGVLIAAAYVGQLAGAFLFTSLAERFGRVRSAAAAVAIIAVMSFGCAFAGSFPMLLFFRFAQGIGIGGEMPVAAAYISELLQARGRGRFFLLYEIIFPVGLMAAGQAGAWLVPAWGWQAIFLVGGVPCVLVAILLARLPESPRWLISRGRLAEADAIIRQIEASAGRTNPSAPAVPSVEAAPASGPLRRTHWGELLSEAYRGRTLIVWGLWFCAFFVANGLNNWMPASTTRFTGSTCANPCARPR